jgi:hypothetical protein
MQFAVLDTFVSMVTHDSEAHGEFGISLAGDYHCPASLWDFIPSFCVAKWCCTAMWLFNLVFALTPQLLQSGYFPMVSF